MSNTENAATNEAEDTPSNAFINHTYRENIVDRTGELLTSAVHTAENLRRKIIGQVADPRDNTVAHFVIGDTVETLPATAFDAYRTKPLRRVGTSTHSRVESFIGITNRFRDPNSVIFADDNATAPKLTAVFDYNPNTPFNDDARFGKHRAIYPFPLSPEWQAWFGSNDTPLSMADFAAFIDDHIVDVLADPGELGPEAQRYVKTTGGKFATPSKLVEISRGLQVNEGSVLKEARNLSTGEAQFTFETQHTDADGKPLVLPNMFVIAIPVFQRSDVVYRLIARLRYRRSAGGLVFFYELWRPDLIFTDAFEEAVEKVRAETEVHVFYGAPEA